MRPISIATVYLLIGFAANSCSAGPPGSGRPNILWITSEDNGPHLGAYGDDFADTSNLDRLAGKGLIYLNAWSNAPVCAPARTTIISGVYPPATGSQHMRSRTKLPTSMKMYPQYLREAGYYCTNNSKEDYNLAKPGKVWDESSRRAHWKNRAAGQPFFAIFNFTVSHESQIRKRPHRQVHDPAQVRVPAYHPDTPEVRQDWAQYYDKITEMDRQVGARLRELEKAGLADDTIVFYYGDHGSGMPRSKRWPYNSGLHVPMIVHVPDKFKHLCPPDYQAGGRSDRLVSFVDLAPTVLSLAGVEPPTWMQGHAFLGKNAAPPQPYVYGFRGRMDERYDMVRSVRNQRYVYIRNYMRHRPYGQYLSYMFQTPTTQVWKKMYDAGELQPPQTYFWEPKPYEELYDLREDQDEVRNLANSPQHESVLRKLRQAMDEWQREIRDLGFLPEHEIHARCGDATPYELGQDRDKYPLDQIMTVAKTAASEHADAKALISSMDSPESAIRYWAVTGLLIRGAQGVQVGKVPLRKALHDSHPCVRVVAAEALGRFGEDGDVKQSVEVLLDAASPTDNGLFVAMFALNALDQLDDKASHVQNQIKALPTSVDGVDGRLKNYIPRLLEKTLADLEK